MLRRSYRCSAPILAAANRLAAPLGQDLGADPQSAAAGAPVAVVACEDGDDELRRIAAWARAHDRDGERAGSGSHRVADAAQRRPG